MTGRPGRSIGASWACNQDPNAERDRRAKSTSSRPATKIRAQPSGVSVTANRGHPPEIAGPGTAKCSAISRPPWPASDCWNASSYCSCTGDPDATTVTGVCRASPGPAAVTDGDATADGGEDDTGRGR